MSLGTQTRDTGRNPNLRTFNLQYKRSLRMPVCFNFEVQTKLAMFRRLTRQLPVLSEGLRVLDLGFGYGGMLFCFPRHYELGGIDITPTAVERMKVAAQKRGYRVFRFECIDLEKEPIPYADASVDVTVCSHLIEHVADDRQLLREIGRVLKPGGHLILMIPINENDRNAHPLHIRCYTEESLRALLEAHGLRVRAEDKADTLYHVFDRIGHLVLPRPFDVVRGKGIALLGAMSFLFPPLWSLRCWGVPRDYGVLARREEFSREEGL